MSWYKFPFQISIISFIFLLFFTSSYEMPLSQCIKGRFSFISDSSINTKTCNLGSSTKSDLYSAVINSGLFNTYAQCGVCYEMIGPVGAIKLRVVDSCDKNSDEKCLGDISHFKVGKIPINKILGTNEESFDENKNMSITFRMISCNYTEKIKILTGDNDDYTFSFVVLNNNIAISSVRLQENGSDKFKKLTRLKDDNNYWTYDPETEISYPLTIKIMSISDETVNITVSSKESDEVYESDGNFVNPNGYFYYYDTLKRDKDTDSLETCCSYDFSDFSPLYYNGKINSNYEKNYYNLTLNESSNILYENKNTMEIKFSSYGKLILKSNLPIRADQYVAISLDIQGNKICKDCLYISSYGNNADSKINIKKANTFSKSTFSLTQLGINDNTFNGIIIYTKDQNIGINIANIELLENSDAPSAELCADGMADWTPVVPSSPTTPSQENNTSSKTDENILTEENTEINDTISNDLSYSDIESDNNIINGTNVLIKINNISQNPNMDAIIVINCEPFEEIKNETLKILFTSNSSQFETLICLLPKNLTTIISFSCQIPQLNTIQNNIYIVQSPPENQYIINYPYKINIENGNIIFNYIPQTQPEPEQKSDSTIPLTTQMTNQITSQITNILTSDVTDTDANTEVINIKKKIEITNSIEKIISKGENIIFQINPINIEDYNRINLNQIILLSESKANSLFLKKCQSNYLFNNTINRINCIVSNNLIKDSYTSLSSGQNIDLSENQKINLTSTASIGGSFSADMSKTINANISRSAKRNYTLDFDIKFYGQNDNLKPKTKYPYNIYLYGIKSSNIRKLQNNDNNYNTHITFNNCTLGSYNQENDYIDGINCQMPDFVSAGSYSKLESEGFDVNPNYKLNIEFPYDFNKSENYLQGNGTDTNGNVDYKDDDEDDGNSKEWIIWLVLGIVCAGLVAVIIIAFIVNKRKKMKVKADESNNGNITNSNNNNNDNSVDKIDNNNNKNDKKENSISESQSS